MSKMLISSYSLHGFLEDLAPGKLFEFKISKNGFECCGKICEGDGISASDEVATLDGYRVGDFMVILARLHDQPIVIQIYDGRLGLMEAVL